MTFTRLKRIQEKTISELTAKDMKELIELKTGLNKLVKTAEVYFLAQIAAGKTIKGMVALPSNRPSLDKEALERLAPKYGKDLFTNKNKSLGELQQVLSEEDYNSIVEYKNNLSYE